MDCSKGVLTWEIEQWVFTKEIIIQIPNLCPMSGIQKRKEVLNNKTQQNSNPIDISGTKVQSKNDVYSVATP